MENEVHILNSVFIDKLVQIRLGLWATEEMFLTDLNNQCKEQISTLVVKDLATELKFKIKKDKDKSRRFTTTKKIFGQPIQAVTLKQVTLNNNTSVQVPLFVHQACERILMNVTTEGIFRRGGSTVRQKAIRVRI